MTVFGSVSGCLVGSGNISFESKFFFISGEEIEVEGEGLTSGVCV